MQSRASFVIAAACALLLAGCDGSGQHIGEVTSGGNPQRGAAEIARYGCGSCHIIPGISGANGLAGPPLSGIGSRIYIAGVLQNTPGNMVRWIQNPKAVDEKTLMPDLGVKPSEARDIAGYLYTLK